MLSLVAIPAYNNEPIFRWYRVWEALVGCSSSLDSESSSVGSIGVTGNHFSGVDARSAPIFEM